HRSPRLRDVGIPLSQRRHALISYRSRYAYPWRSRAAEGGSVIAPTSRPGDFHGIRSARSRSTTPVAGQDRYTPRQGIVATASNAAFLVVDDDEGNRYILTRLLARAGYANVAVAANGPEALEALRARKFDIVLLDVLMPGLDGFEVCERLQADEATRDIPI